MPGASTTARGLPVVDLGSGLKGDPIPVPGDSPPSRDDTLASISSMLDNAFGTTRGAILYRGAAVWAELPPGTSGWFLETHGVGADPTWAAVVSGDVFGPGSAVDGDFAQFNGTTGKIIKDGGLSLDTDGTLAANSDTRIPSQKAVKTYAVTKTGAPASGNLAKFSGGSSVTNGDLSGDVSTAGTLATTIKTNIALPGSPTTTTQGATDNSTKVATTAYVTTAIANAVAAVNPAVAVDVATTAAANTSGLTYNNGVGGIGATLTGAINTPITIDGVTFNALGQRLLVKNDTQSPSGAFNGVYTVTQLQTAILPPILTRALDYDQSSDINNTGAIPVKSGMVNALTSWLLSSLVTTVGTDPLTYVQFSFAPVSAANPSATASDVAVNGSAATYMRSDGAPAVQLGSNAQFGLAKGDGTTVSISAGIVSVIGSGVTGTGADADFDLMFFGTGIDGDLAIAAGTTNLTRDMFYHNLTISGTGKLNLNGWRVYVSGTLDLTNAPAGAIVSVNNLGVSLNGTNGTNLGNSGAGGSSLSVSNTVGKGQGGGAGGVGATGAGVQAVAVANGGNALPNTAGTGGKGGNTGSAGGAARAGGTGAQPLDIRKLTDQLFTWQNGTINYIIGGIGAPGGGGGAGDGVGAGGGGGGGGATPGVVWIAARTIARSSSTTAAAAINADAGNGGNGGSPTGGTNAGGGGGAGGAPGGWVMVIYRFLTGTAKTGLVSAAGGNGGNGGTGRGTGIGGDGGASGSRGRLDLYNLAAGTWTHAETDTTTVAGTAGSGATAGTGGTANSQSLSL